MRIAQHPYLDEEQVNIYFSFGFFVLGIMAFGHLGHFINPRRRVSLFLSASTQALLVWIATALVCFVSDKDVWPISAIVVALLALQAGGQINLSIQMQQQDINTTMITGALIQVCTDANIFAASNTNRDRKILFYLFFLFGCFSGSVVSMYTSHSNGFLIYAGCKTFLALTFLFNPGMNVSG